MNNFAFVLFFMLSAETVYLSLQRGNEIIFVDFRADATPRKLRDCMDGPRIEAPSGLKVPPNTMLSLDLNKLALLYNYTGTRLSLVLQYGPESLSHPSIQLGIVCTFPHACSTISASHKPPRASTSRHIALP